MIGFERLPRGSLEKTVASCRLSVASLLEKAALSTQHSAKD